jgi:hypothetical protein
MHKYYLKSAPFLEEEGEWGVERERVIDGGGSGHHYFSRGYGWFLFCDISIYSKLYNSCLGISMLCFCFQFSHVLMFINPYITHVLLFC